MGRPRIQQGDVEWNAAIRGVVLTPIQTIKSYNPYKAEPVPESALAAAKGSLA